MSGTAISGRASARDICSKGHHSPDVDRLLVIGIGNVLLGDEGAGVHAARRLAGRVGRREGLRILDGGTLGFALAPEIAFCDALIVLDAAELGAEPGAVRCLIDADMDRHLGGTRRSVHEVGLLDLMDIARLSGTLPRRRALIGIQIQAVEWRDGLCSSVDRGVDAAVSLSLQLLDEWSKVPGHGAHADTCGRNRLAPRDTSP